MTNRFSQLRRVAPCLMSIIVDYMGFGLVYPLVTAMFTIGGGTGPIFPHMDSLHLRDFYLGLAYLFYPLGMFFGASFLGDLSDIWGRKRVIILSVAGISLSFLIMAGGIMLRSVWLFLFGRLFSGLMAGSQPLAQAAIADVSTPESKPWNMSLITLTNCVGLVFGPIIAGIFSETWFIKEVGYSPPFLAAALLAFLTVVWIQWGFHETYLFKVDRKIEWLRPMRIFVEAFLDKKVRLLALIGLLFQLAVALYFQTSGIFLAKEFHYSSSLIGYFYAFLGLSFVTGVLVSYPIALKYFKLEHMTIFGLIIMGALECIAGFIKMDWLYWIVIFWMANFNIIAWTPLLTIFSNSVGPERQGWGMGILAAMVAVGFIFAGFSINLLTLIPTYGIIFIGGLIAILSGFLMWFYKVKHSSETADI